MTRRVDKLGGHERRRIVGVLTSERSPNGDARARTAYLAQPTADALSADIPSRGGVPVAVWEVLSTIPIPAPGRLAPRPGHRRCDRVGAVPGRSTDPGGDRGMGRGPARLEVPTWISGRRNPSPPRSPDPNHQRPQTHQRSSVRSARYLTHAQPRTITTWTQGHWGIGNALTGSATSPTTAGTSRLRGRPTPTPRRQRPHA